MHKEFKRNTRVGQQLQKEISNILQFDLKNSSLGMVTVSGVDLSPDLKNAKVFVTFLGIDAENDIKDRLEKLNTMVPVVKKYLAKNMILRIVPSIKFHYDESLLYGIKMSTMIDDALNHK